MSKDTISERQQVRDELDWIRDLKQKDVDRIMRSPNMRGEDSSMKLVYEDCGIETNILLWRTLLSVNLYVSERPLHELRKLYIRTYIDVKDLANSVRQIAVTIGSSEKFVRESLAERPQEDPRQVKMFDKEKVS